MKKIIIGIDPGLTGGIAILDSGSKELITVVDMPVVPEGGKKKVSGNGLMKIIGGYTRQDVQMVYLEKVGARPGQGVVSMFNFGRSYGAIESAVSVLGFSLTYVTPQRWKRSAGLMGAPNFRLLFFCCLLFSWGFLSSGFFGWLLFSSFHGVSPWVFNFGFPFRLC